MANLPKVVKKTLADVLLQEGIVPPNQLQEAQVREQSVGESLGAILLNMGILSELELARAYSKQYNLPFVDASRYAIPKEVTDLIPVEEMQRNRYIVLDKIGKVLLIALSDVPAIEVLEDIENRTGSVVFAFVTTAGQLAAGLSKSYFKAAPKAAAPVPKAAPAPAAPKAEAKPESAAPKAEPAEAKPAARVDVPAPTKPKTAVPAGSTLKLAMKPLGAPKKAETPPPGAAKSEAPRPTTTIKLPETPAAPKAELPAATPAPAAPAAPGAPQLSSAGRVEFKLVAPKKKPPSSEKS